MESEEWEVPEQRKNAKKDIKDYMERASFPLVERDSRKNLLQEKRGNKWLKQQLQT